MTIQLDILSAIQEGERLRDEGIARAIDHAGEKWTDRIFFLFKEWLSDKPEGFEFMTETFRMHVERNSLAEIPPSKRSWAFLSMRAKTENLIIWAGTARTTDSSSHRTPAHLWRKL